MSSFAPSIACDDRQLAKLAESCDACLYIEGFELSAMPAAEQLFAQVSS